ncbi:MAG: rRNA pseudouridine synthase [Anaerolineae bacterium]|nr:rRNA pseudouridine synthase [Anaerolineae bacterium]
MKERLQKLMAQANLGSRRACEDLIRQGRVRVNGKVIHLGDQADPRADIIEVDGEKLAFPEQKLYIAFNKPKYVLSDDGHKDDNRKTVRDFLPYSEHLFSAGRLDIDSEGLMVLTNDGELANRLTHPRFRHTKTYKVVVVGLPSPETLEKWQRGVTIIEEDGSSYRTAPCSVTITDGGKETTLRVIMTEGKKRQIRRVAAQLGHPVLSLIRTQIGKLGLGSLRPGEWRELEAKDLAALKTPSSDFAPAKAPRSRRPAAAKKPAGVPHKPSAPSSSKEPRRGGSRPPGRRPRRSEPKGGR